MEIPALTFSTLVSIRQFLNRNKTDHATYFAKQMKDDIKLVGKSDVYFYDKTKKLWVCGTHEIYEGLMAEFLNETGKNLMKAFKKLNSENEDDDGDLKTKKDIAKLRENFDTQTWISNITSRSAGKLQDGEFFVKLNNNPDFLPILNGKKIDLRDSTITDRVKSDYFSFECPVEVTKSTKHADKFFSQVAPDAKIREYLRMCLGYMLTGNMDARCFFIWYGKGSNGKSVIMKLMRSLMGQYYHQCGKGIFMKGKNENVSGPAPDKVALIGCRLGTYSEGETADEIEMNEGFIKLVCGRDPISARQLYGILMNFIPQVKLNLLTNFIPDLQGDESILERIRYIFLDSKFIDNPDPKKSNEFKKDDEFIDALNEKYLSEIFT